MDKSGLAATFAFGIGTRDEFSAGIYHLDNSNGAHYGMPWLAPAAGSTDRVLVPANPKN